MKIHKLFVNVKIRNKFLFTIIPMVILTVALMMFVSLYIAKTSIIEIQENKLNSIVQSAIWQVDNWARKRIEFARTLSKTSDLVLACNGENWDQAQETLCRFMSVNAENENLFLADTRGRIFLDSIGGKSVGVNIAELDDFKKNYEAAIEAKPWVSDVHPSPATGKPVCLITVPVIKDEKVVGIFGSPVDFRITSEVLLSGASIGTEGYLAMVDSFGRTIAHPNEELILNLDIDAEDFGRQILSQKNGNIQYEFNNARKIASFAQCLKTDWIVMAIDTRDAFVAPVRSLVYYSTAISVVSASLLCLVLIYIADIVSRPINKVVEILKDIAQGQGDLTKRIDIDGKDEIGQLAKWFNRFTDKIQTMVKNIASNSNKLSTSSSQLAGISQQMSESISSTSNRSTSVAASAQQMSSSMTSVAAAMEQAATNVNMVATASEQMTSTINEIARNTEKASSVTIRAVNESKRASSRVNELGQAAKLIGKVTETISDISEQTNLLALNATIEAARAGDAGKGFAVVANEIKDLANQTALSTEEIREKIESIQNSTALTVDEIGKVTTIIQEINELVSTIASAVEEQSTTTREIAANVSQASSGIQEVNGNVSQSSLAAGQIASDINRVSQSSAEINNGSQQISESAGELSRLADQLNTMVNQFQV